MIPVQYAARPGGVFVESIATTFNVLINPVLVCDDESNIRSCHVTHRSFVVEFTVHHCGYNMSLPTTYPNSTVRMSTIHAGTPPVTGTFHLTFENRTIYNISASSSSADLKNLLESYLPNEGLFDVTRTGNCAGYLWNIKWTQRGGDLSLMSSDGRNLSGNNASVSVLPQTDGGVWMRSLRGDMLQLPKQQPQVSQSLIRCQLIILYY